MKTQTPLDWFFRYLNTLPMPLWLAMMFAPRHPLTERMSRSGAVFALMAAHYLGALAAAVRGSGGAKVDFTSLEGVRAALGSREGTVAAWAHLLALDLFAGAWVFRESRRLDAPGYVRVPALFGTLMAGPVGLLFFLVWRAVARGRLQIED